MCEGYAAHATYSGPEAVKLAQRIQPHIAIIDIQMPGMSGYAVARELMRAEREPRPLLIAITAWGQESDKLAVKQAGFDHHLTKPVDVPALLRLLSQRS